MTIKKTASILDVIDNGFCIGCGTCTSVPNSPFKMEFDSHRLLQAKANTIVNTDNSTVPSKVCPFSDDALNETELANIFLSKNQNQHPIIGRYTATYAGYVIENDYRKAGSSGGFGTWLLNELLEKHIVDYVVHVTEHPQREIGAPLFSYSISSSKEKLKLGAKSKYYPIELSKVISSILETDGSYAVVGVPCFIKSLRLLALENPVIRKRIKYHIGLVCGHLKSTRFAESFGWEMGIHPSKLRKFDFRKKLAGRPSSDYAVEAEGIDERGQLVKASKPTRELLGHNWGHGFFKYKACDFCDDVLGETADVTIGDAWLPKYKADPQGTNIIITKNKEIDSLIRAAASENRIHLDPLSEDEICQSQNAGLRHKTDGLKYRLYLSEKKKLWHPRKRVEAQKSHLSRSERAKIKARDKIRKSSHTHFQSALQKDSFSYFKKKMNALILKLPEHQSNKLHRRLLRFIKRSLRPSK